jgi:N,N-dimethylformamidase
MAPILPITGYLDRFSHRTGETFTAHVSAATPGPARARLVRVVSGDPNPQGPGMRLVDMAGVFQSSFNAAIQPIRLGSYGLVPAGPVRAAGAACTWTLLVWMAAAAPTRAAMAEHGAASVILRVGAEGASASLSWPGGKAEIATGTAMRRLCWYRVWVSADPTSGRIAIGQATLDDDAMVAETHAAGVALPASGAVMFAASNPADPGGHFTGKLEAPAILPGLHTEPATIRAAVPLASWDFSVGIATQDVTDTGPQSCHGRLVNMPTRAVVGAHWTGAEHCWRHAPADYAAIHFHDDDIDDCRWRPSFSFTVPASLRSGAYALHISNDRGEDWLPFYVLPPRTGPFAPIVFLASTFTYQAYANHARGNAAEAAYRDRVAAWSAYPHNPDDFPIYGRSTYNRHADNAGIGHSTRLRPILTMRPGFLTFHDPRGSGLRHYPADTHLLAWLEAKGFDFDIVTDEDLDDEGVALIAPYKAVITGSHPEYHTPGTLDALTAYKAQGGRLAYLGGNGFYWKIARDKAVPHMIELRRAEGGIRAWQAEPGEYYHATDGQMGGLWRRNRRPPQLLAAVGFSGQGKFEGTHYRRLPASHAPEFAWMFDGIDGDIIGDYGLSGGGAAGFELDRADTSLGTPDNAVILARSEDPPASFVTVSEELLSHLATVSGETPGELMRGEIVYLDTPQGGAVFAVGSITFCGSLWQDGFRGSVSRLLENVVRRFQAN